MTRTLQRVLVGACLAMVALLSVVQATVRTPPPAFLFVLFAGVWVYGAVMLLVAPRFGAWGTAAYGVILGVQVLRMHGGSTVNWLIAGGSLGIAALAVVYALALRKEGRG